MGLEDCIKLMKTIVIAYIVIAFDNTIFTLLLNYLLLLMSWREKGYPPVAK